MMTRTLYLFGAIALGLATVAPLALAAAKTKPAASNLGVTTQDSYFTLPDPKMPGKLSLKVWVKRVEGGTVGNGFVGGTFHGVSAILFQHGKATAKLTAPKAQGNNLQNVLVATGRVTVTSLLQPGTYLKADKISWFPKTNKVQADGHVTWRDGKSGAVFSGPHMSGDTALKTFSN